MNLYLDASALVKRYVDEPGTDVVVDAMQSADGWFMCRAGLVETGRAIGLAGKRDPLRAFKEEWPAFGIIEVDQRLVEGAVAHQLCSLDSLHLASATVLPRHELVFATWDRRLHFAGAVEGLELLPRILE